MFHRFLDFYIVDIHLLPRPGSLVDCLKLMLVFSQMLQVLRIEPYQHFFAILPGNWRLPFDIDIVDFGGRALLRQSLLELHRELFFDLFVSGFFLRFALFGIVVEDISDFSENVLQTFFYLS